MLTYTGPEDILGQTKDIFYTHIFGQSNSIQELYNLDMPSFSSAMAEIIVMQSAGDKTIAKYKESLSNHGYFEYSGTDHKWIIKCSKEIICPNKDVPDARH